MEKEFVKKIIKSLDRVFADLRYDIIVQARPVIELDDNNKSLVSHYDTKSQEELDFTNKVHESCLRIILDLAKDKEFE